MLNQDQQQLSFSPFGSEQYHPALENVLAGSIYSLSDVQDSLALFSKADSWDGNGRCINQKPKDQSSLLIKNKKFRETRQLKK